jgi:hypothetical protein
VTNSDKRSGAGPLQPCNVYAHRGRPYETENIQRGKPAAEAPTPAVALSSPLPIAVIAVPDDWFEQSALLRWADDGGRWV